MLDEVNGGRRARRNASSGARIETLGTSTRPVYRRAVVMGNANANGLRTWVSGERPPEGTADTVVVEHPPDSDVFDPSEPPHSLVATDVATRFSDLGEIGRGGMASVRRAKDRNLLRTVAIKILDQDIARHAPEVQRFVEEAQITGQLEHPGIVPVHEMGIDQDGVHYICMRYVRGRTLEETIADAGDDRLSSEKITDLLQIFVKVCDAVAFAHSRGVLHRDIKPSNVMVGEFGQVYVVDWGIARPLPGGSGAVSVRRPEGLELDHPGAPLGTFGYMAPEQLRGDSELDARTDVFALGATLFHILTGEAPYRPGSMGELVLQIAFAEIPDPHSRTTCTLPEGLCRIVRRATALERNDRYPSVIALRDDVQRFLRGGMHLPSRDFAAGEFIVREGEAGHEAFIVVSGRCAVFKNSVDGEVLVRELGPDEVFGETAIVSRKPRTASVQALEPVTVLVVSEKTLSDALGLRGWMGKFVRALAERFREADDQLYSQRPKRM